MSTDLGSVAALRSETTEVGLDQRDKLQFTMSSVINKGYRPGLIVYNLSYNQYDYSLQLKASSIIYRINYLLSCNDLTCDLVDVVRILGRSRGGENNDKIQRISYPKHGRQAALMECVSRHG